MAAVRIRPSTELAESARAAFDHHRQQVLRLIPGAEVEHVGATAVPGALTKGDLDVLVRVHPSEFSDAVAALHGVYAIHQPHNWTPTLASFNDPASSAPPVGVQLVVAGSASDALFGPFREALIADPALLAEYNALKLRLNGESYEHYTATKGAFVGSVGEAQPHVTELPSRDLSAAGVCALRRSERSRRRMAREARGVDRRPRAVICDRVGNQSWMTTSVGLGHFPGCSGPAADAADSP